MSKYKLGVFVRDDLYFKIGYIAKFFGQSVSALVISVLLAYIGDFESEHGVIEVQNG